MKKIILMIAAASILPIWSCRTDKKSPEQIESGMIDAKERTAQHDDSLDTQADYRTASEARLFENERDIATLRESPPSSKKKKAGDKETIRVYRQRIDSLEKKNNELRSRLKQYKDTDKSRWEQFKSSFSSDLDQMRQSLKNIGNNSSENDSK